MGRKIQWHTWARLQAMTAGFALIIGGFAGVLFPLVAIGAYSLALGVFLVLFEYPIPGLGNLGFFSTNMWFRTILYFLLSAPNFFQTPGIVGGSFLFCAACTYFASAKTGEVWRHPRAPPPREERKPKAPEGGAAAERPKSLAPGSLGNPNGNSLNPYSSNYNGNSNPYAGGPSTRDPYTGPAAVAQRPPKPPMDPGMAGGYGMGGGGGSMGYSQSQGSMGMPMQQMPMQQQQQQYGGYPDQGGYNNNPMARGPPKPPMYNGGGAPGPYDNSGYSTPASARSSSNASSIGRQGPPGMPPKPNMAPKPTSPPMSQYGAPPKPRMNPPQVPQGNPYMMNNYN